METSVLLVQNIRAFHQRSPMFCNFRAVTSLPYKKGKKIDLWVILRGGIGLNPL